MPGIYAKPFRPEQFGAVGNGVADDTAATQAAINAAKAAGGGVVLLSNKTYRVTQAGTLDGRAYCLLLTGHGVSLAGEGLSSRLACATAGADTVLVRLNTGDEKAIAGPVIESVYFNPLVQKTDAAYEIYCPFVRRLTLRDLRFGEGGSLPSGMPVPAADPPEAASLIGSCVKLGGQGGSASTVLLENVTGYGYHNFIDCRNIVDVRLSNCEGDGKRIASQPLYFGNGCEAIMMSNCDFINTAGLGGFSTAPCMILDGTGIFTATNCYWDTHLTGIRIVRAINVQIVNSWINSSGAGGWGLEINPANPLDVSSVMLSVVSMFPSNGGILLGAGSDLSLKQVRMFAVGGDGTATAVQINENASDVLIDDILAHNPSLNESKLRDRYGAGGVTVVIAATATGGRVRATNIRHRDADVTYYKPDVTRG